MKYVYHIYYNISEDYKNSDIFPASNSLGNKMFLFSLLRRER